LPQWTYWWWSAL